MKPFLKIVFLLISVNVYGQLNEKDILISFGDEKDECGYKNLKGEIIIPLGKYSLCFTDTFRTYAIVLSDSGFIAINQTLVRTL